jgi:SPOR domain
MKITFTIFSLLLIANVYAQSDTNAVMVYKDPRIDMLVKKQIDINEEATRDSRRTAPGYRILVVNSNDRKKVFAAKAKIYQLYPDLKPYLLYQAPFYKLKVGNFKSKDEAQEYLQELLRDFPTGLYIVKDIIEVKPERTD